MSAGESVAVLWQRLESWAGENAPEMLRDLNPGADDADIGALQAAFSHPLPASYKDSLKVHNGESDGWPNRVFADMGAYHSTESAINDYNMYLKVGGHGTEFDDGEIAEQIENDIITVDGPVRPLTFCPDWLPIMNCNGDVFWALDFAPDEGGNKGQVIQVDLECCSWAVVAPDFGTFFQTTFRVSKTATTKSRKDLRPKNLSIRLSLLAIACSKTLSQKTNSKRKGQESLLLSSESVVGR